MLILSDAAQKSKWIPRELDQAINDDKVIFPYVIENFHLNDEFSFYLANVQRYEAWKNESVAKEKLLREIRLLLRPDWEQEKIPIFSDLQYSIRLLEGEE